MSIPAIRIENFTKRYGKFTAVDNLSLEVPKGSIFGLLGQNGAGKTTTIRTMLNLLQPTEGSIQVLRLDSVKDSLDVRKRIGAHPLRLTDAGREDPLFSFFPPRFSAQFGHHDHVESAPEGVTVLATGEAGDCLAFRVDGSNFWAAQFHAELDKRTTLDRWSHYRDLYAGEDGAEIDRRVAEEPDTPDVKKTLEGLVRLALERRESK